MPSLRTTVRLAIAAAAVYGLLIVTYIAVQTRRIATATRATEDVTRAFGDIGRRSQQAFDRVDRARDLLGAPTVDSVAASRLADEVRLAARRRQPVFHPNAPSSMRSALAGVDRRLSSLETLILELASRVELGRLDQARAQLADAERLEREVGSDMAVAQRIGLSDLRARQEQLLDRTDGVLRLVAVWLVIGLALAPVIVMVVHRRVRRPLDELEGGLERVARGDLTARVTARYDDEIGRLVRHFNEMTAVLSKRAEQQGRLAAAGELVAGVAHEVNNPLMAIALLAETRLDEVGQSAEQRDDLQQIARQARRAGTLLSGLLRFARPGERRVEAHDLPAIVRDSLDLISYQFGVDEIGVETHVTGDLPPVRCDRSRVEQVFVNLLSNAAQAVRSVDPPRLITVNVQAVEERVDVAISDNGPGIPHGDRDRIFTPFFTTKGKDGTGLGLYISRQIMREDGGDLRVESTGGGARVVASFPTSADRPRRRTPDPERRAGSLGGIRVLIVDDEESIRRPLSRFLERRGAQVHHATDGLDALTKLERYTVDVILLDIRMPRMDGVEFYTQLLQIRPALAERVVFVSGDFQQLERAQDFAMPGDRSLAKPVDLLELEAVVRQVATGTPTPSSAEPPPPTR